MRSASICGGCEDMVAIGQLADSIMAIVGKKLRKRRIPGPLGVRGRNSDNRFIEQKLGWRLEQPLSAGLAITCDWIENQIQEKTGTIAFSKAAA
jgi:GDP-D-mannose 3',5'-epimerase